MSADIIIVLARLRCVKCFCCFLLIEGILEKKLSKLSAQSLQQVALCACVVEVIYIKSYFPSPNEQSSMHESGHFFWVLTKV